MEDPEDLTFSRLELCTYRYLQQIAKSMALPSNVKKVYLIEMIYAKKYRSAEELDAIVVRIREERKLNAQTRKPPKKKKKRLQGTEISSTSNQSPPINLTPRRSSGGIIPYPHQVRQTILKYQQQSNILHSSTSKRAIESDRVLRSFHNRMRPNYSLMNFNNSFFDVIEAQNARMEQDARERQYRLSVGSQTQSQIDIDDCVMHRRMPIGYKECTDASQRQIGYEDSTGEENNQLVPVSRRLNYSPPIPANRQRRLSGIYPLKPPETAFYMRSFGVRGEDGRISKINAVVQKPLIGTLKPLERNKLKTVPRSVLNPIVRNHSFSERNLSQLGRESKAIIVRRNAIRTIPMVSVHDLIPRPPPDIATVQEIVDYKNDQSSFSNSSTETATETSVERDNIENINRKTINKNYGIVNLGRYSESNYGTQNTKRYTDKACNTPENMNIFSNTSNYTRENRVRYKGINYTENPNCRYADKSNRAVEYANRHTEKVYPTENTNKYAQQTKYTENVNRFVENTTYALENPTTHAQSTNYAAENMNAYIENSNYAINPNMYPESGYAIENGYATKDVNRNAMTVVHNTESRNMEDYPNMSALTDIDLDAQSTELISKQNSNCSVYYHKKIRAEQVRSHRPLLTKESEATEERLPRISEVFNQFHDAECRRSHPLSLQTGDEAGNAAANNAHTLLESLYNFRPQFLTNQPLDKIKTTDNTRCVYSVPTITSAAEYLQYSRPELSFVNNDTALVQRDNQEHKIETETVPRLYDYFKMAEQDRMGIVSEEVISSSSSSFGATSKQELEANATIPEMVEDALELISQDGDYMERIEMDVRMQCILCEWAGPKIILEYHIRKEHSSQLVQQSETEWRFAIPHGAVCSGAGGEGGGVGGGFSFHPVLYKQNIYVLATSCTELHFTAMLMVLPTVSDEVSKFARITVYNKVTGEPHAWEGDIVDLPETVPFETGCNGLKLDITELNLLPNSANLKLVRGELVVSSTAKVVVGHTETSRVLNSTFRYVKFVKRLRAQEEEQRKGNENKLKEIKDQQISDFFVRCDRRSLMNNVARRVDLCMASYEEDLNRKRQRLIELYSEEEKENIRKFVEQAQAGREAVWQDKQDRLRYLLEKRKREHAEKYKDTPLSKCVHVLPCIWKLRAKEAAEIQLYQIKEKEARKMADKEFDNMWYEVAMKESEALKARMEQDAIERYRRDLECTQHSDLQLEQNRLRREKEREMLKEETKRFKAIWDEDIKKEEQAELKRTEKRMETARDRAEMIKERQITLEKQEAEAQLIAKTWDSLTGQGQAEENAQIKLAKKKERENDECNRQLIKLKNEIASLENANDDLVEAELRKHQSILDEKRCAYKLWSQKTNRDIRNAMVDQIKDRQAAREVLKQKLAEQDEYERQVFGQVEQLTDLKKLTDAQMRKQHQKQLLAQIEYNKTLKERARQEEVDQRKKYQIATEEYQQEIQRMLCRPFFSDEVHPFMKQMAKGLKMKEKCPCSKPDYCQ